ncbi:lactonase family protein [Prolixibacter bellariivorans]|nr:lactonase family protein [Prolixibacter bellariivorans]
MKKNIFLLLMAGAAVFAGPAKSLAQDNSKSGMMFYIGTYTDGSDSKGIYRCELDPKSGQLENYALAGVSVNPSFVTLTPDGNYLLAVQEKNTAVGNTQGYIESFAVDKSTGNLKAINKEPSGGADPCFVSVNPEGFALTANYSSGSVGLFRLNGDGTISKALYVSQHEGHGPNVNRQKGPHAHSSYFGPGGKRIFAADLGTDDVYVYRLDADNGKLVPCKTPKIPMAPGAGPRHIAFGPNGQNMYVISEMGCTVTRVAMKDDGGFDVKESVSTLPKGYDGENTCAEIAISPDGKYLYASNRGLDNIVIFSIDPQSGKLTEKGTEGVRGKTPRNFTLSPDGKFVLVANQNSNNIVAFRRNPETGMLTYTSEIKAPKPVCLLFR